MVHLVISFQRDRQRSQRARLLRPRLDPASLSLTVPPDLRHLDRFWILGADGRDGLPQRILQLGNHTLEDAKMDNCVNKVLYKSRSTFMFRRCLRCNHVGRLRDGGVLDIRSGPSCVGAREYPSMSWLGARGCCRESP